MKSRILVEFEGEVHVQAEIPVNAMLDLDTVIETDILKIGKIRIPIRGQIPLSLKLPISGPMRVQVSGLPIDLDETLSVPVPALHIPLDEPVVAKVTLL